MDFSIVNDTSIEAKYRIYDMVEKIKNSTILLTKSNYVDFKKFFEMTNMFKLFLKIELDKELLESDLTIDDIIPIKSYDEFTVTEKNEINIFVYSLKFINNFDEICHMFKDCNIKFLCNDSNAVFDLSCFKNKIIFNRLYPLFINVDCRHISFVQIHEVNPQQKDHPFVAKTCTIDNYSSSQILDCLQIKNLGINYYENRIGQNILYRKNNYLEHLTIDMYTKTPFYTLKEFLSKFPNTNMTIINNQYYLFDFKALEYLLKNYHKSDIFIKLSYDRLDGDLLSLIKKYGFFTVDRFVHSTDNALYKFLKKAHEDEEKSLRPDGEQMLQLQQKVTNQWQSWSTTTTSNNNMES